MARKVRDLRGIIIWGYPCGVSGSPRRFSCRSPRNFSCRSPRHFSCRSPRHFSCRSPRHFSCRSPWNPTAPSWGSFQVTGR
ncbi:hypothetical protein GDO81_013430 [Engystomops pustulosus]|uniref:Uncharacterized protein n=1 Tax=Engystomops pustulosus TaxID=76066 RepID=A0AAV7AZI9_ENGPU|nr:hypothetical protein GDO81_026393 [Engystomops pustulosus]KAG8566941.1 hypothetical protein GDO81_013430 [Engystomops pustulosus]